LKALPFTQLLMPVMPLQTTSERVDDLPLIVHWLKEMQIAEILDKRLMPAHQNRQGLSYGQLSVLFVAYVVTQADHRLNQVEAWVRAHHRALEAVTGWRIGAKDASDDRLADLLSVLGGSDDLSSIEDAMPCRPKWRAVIAAVFRSITRATTGQPMCRYCNMATAKTIDPTCCNIAIA
jgi:Domain of unknown function (DUF4277)